MYDVGRVGIRSSKSYIPQWTHSSTTCLLVYINEGIIAKKKIYSSLCLVKRRVKEKHNKNCLKGPSS